MRAFLNYNRIPYDIVEVTAVRNTEIKWSLYDQLPIVVVENERVQLNDSNLIISAIESYLRQPTKTFKNITKLYQSIVEKDQKGHLNFTYPNRYAIVEASNADRLELVKEQDKSKVNNQSKSFFARLFSRTPTQPEVPNENSSIVSKKSAADNEFEQQWREWADNKFLHVIAPNIYPTLKQSLDTFQWFSKAGNWEEIFPWYQRVFFIYAGAVGMRLLATRLKKKYNLNDDVRLSLYECGEEWVNAVGEKHFLGKTMRYLLYRISLLFQVVHNLI